MIGILVGTEIRILLLWHIPKNGFYTVYIPRGRWFRPGFFCTPYESGAITELRRFQIPYLHLMGLPLSSQVCGEGHRDAER